MTDRLKRFLAKYTFPIHLFQINRKLSSYLRNTIWTGYNYTRLIVLRASVGPGFRSDGRIYIRTQKHGQIEIGKNVCLMSHPGTNLVGLTNPCVLHCHGDGHIVIGDHSGGSAVILSSKSSIRIGRYVKLGGNVRVFDHDYHALDYQDRRHGATDKANCRTKPVMIGDDVFVGTNSIILKGVTLGDLSLIHI